MFASLGMAHAWHLEIIFVLMYGTVPLKDTAQACNFIVSNQPIKCVSFILIYQDYQLIKMKKVTIERCTIEYM